MPTIPAGSLAFTWNGNGVGPVIYLSPVDLTVLGTAGSIHHEGSDALDDGTFATGFNEIWQPCTIAHLADFAVGHYGGSEARSDYIGRWYAPAEPVGPVGTVIRGYNVSGTVVYESAAFTLIGAGGFPTHAQEVAVGPARDVAYYKINPTGATAVQQRTVYRYNLVGNADLGAWLLEPVRRLRQGQNLLVLRDGTVLVGWSGAGLTSSVLTHYAADGTVLGTYVAAASPSDEPINLVAGATDATVWITYYGSADYSTLEEIRVADMTSVRRHLITTAQKATIDAAAGGMDWQPDLGAFVVTRAACGGDGGGGGTDPPGAPFVAPSYDLDERLIRRLRRAPHLNQENVRVFYRRIELDLERGVGLATGQGEDPLIMLRLSRDGGHTWSEPMEMSAGKIGAYTQRVIARRLGQARDTVFEVTVSDPVAWSLVQAWLDLEAGTS